jgi:ubiquinone/menaquinone biosynthesis C-methylase UbiE
MNEIFEGLFSKEPKEIIENDYFYGVDSEGDQFDKNDEDIWLNQGGFKRNWEGGRQSGAEYFKISDDICNKIANDGKPFMEIACGPGMGLSPIILTKNPKIPCLATDACSRLIKAWRYYINQNLTDHNISLASFNALDIPIKDNSLDYVTSFVGIGSTRNGENGLIKTINEIYRILKPGGYLVALENEWTDLEKLNEVFRYVGWTEKQKEMPWHDKFASAGFQIESESQHYFRNLNKYDNEAGEAADKLGIEIGMKYTLFILRKTI